MFLDLTERPLVVLPAICPASLYVRTRRPSHLTARVYRCLPGRTDSLEPAASRPLPSGMTFDETLFPLPHGRQAQDVSQSWVVSTWTPAEGRADTHDSWRVDVRLHLERVDVYRVTVVDTDKNLPLVSVVFRVDVASLHSDRPPLLGTVRVGTSAYDRILDE